MIPTGLLLAAAAGLSDLAGSALILTGRDGLRKWFDAVLAFGLGFVIAVALGELLPEALEVSRLNVLWLGAGFGLLFLIDRLLKGSGLGLTLAGVVVCDFFDGFAVASAAALAGAAGASEATGEAATGWLLVGGLFPHNFLEGASIALLMLSAGMSRRTSWLVAVALAVASLLGGAAVVLVLPEELRAPIQAMAAGFLLYVVLMQRLPRLLAAERRAAYVALVALGTAAFFALGLLH
ncbi:MAG TPA: ZIP family metal transporter [Chloroflexota bacterium]|jgi:zinc transporter ZupT|nr:ZIP family metal transporter [Chloroflexota bacterium]